MATLAEVHSLTYFETSGWRGVMEHEAGSPQPGTFPSRPGEVFPLWDVLAALAGFGEVFPLRSDQPLAVRGLGLRNQDMCTRLLLANLTGASKTVEVEFVPDAGRVLVLDETNVEDAMREPVQHGSGQPNEKNGRRSWRSSAPVGTAPLGTCHRGSALIASIARGGAP